MNDSGRHDPEVERWIARQPESSGPIDISVVIPCFNEERRLPSTLIEVIDYFDQRQLAYELIVVDDGSNDGTSTQVRRFEKIRKQVNLIRVPKNSGKGFAVRTGVLNSQGTLVLFADADGSTPIAEIERLEKALQQGADMAIGSRAKADAQTHVKTSWYRKYPGRIFNLAVNLIVLPGFADTQCGFKLFRKVPGHFIFERQRANRYSFDVEILYIAVRSGLKIAEVPVNWENVPGSKVNLLLDSLKMLRDLFVFRVRHRGLGPAEYTKYLQTGPHRGNV
ncbi:MAG: glycosyltransferase family 2 protein [Oligoflexia bacterium]|nr:glycosyltransferase family 2 protein [Oligoflexia bacterium]